MKIAVPTRENVVDDHFGHCAYYTLFTVDDDKNITDTETLPSPQGCGCKSNIASVLKEKGVTVMLAGSMGDGALKVLSDQGIAGLPVIRGVNKITGGLLGGVKFVIMVWILFLVVTVLCNTKLGDTALKLIMQDPLLNYLYDKDILIKIFMNIFYAK